MSETKPAAPTLEERVVAVTQRLQGSLAMAAHDGVSIYEALVARLEAIAHRAETTTIPGDLTLLRTEAASLIISLGSWAKSEAQAMGRALAPELDALAAKVGDLEQSAVKLWQAHHSNAAKIEAVEAVATAPAPPAPPSAPKDPGQAFASPAKPSDDPNHAA